MRFLTSIEESIKDILLTPLGSRVMLPEYGSRLFELVDRRVDDSFRADLAYFVIDAVSRWEKRVKVDKVKLNSLVNHSLDFTIYLKSGEIIRIDYVRS
ncbi:MAG: GPW/gp25 family protein [Campylobacter sputorum]|uniref:GPW/gp25 family protein n=1 Tax=Campylobacter sputorum TaxID=206 RepID=UPI002A91E7F7|nr:GPW/gp25 family protein [Campylobacter sputorum]MDY6120432.1 GPW/gp25 family protein [Campylobacter sputorum]